MMSEKERLAILATRLTEFPALADAVTEVITADNDVRAAELYAALTGFFYRKPVAPKQRVDVSQAAKDSDDWAFSIL